jgi:hypothetical protein
MPKFLAIVVFAGLLLLPQSADAAPACNAKCLFTSCSCSPGAGGGSSDCFCRLGWARCRCGISSTNLAVDDFQLENFTNLVTITTGFGGQSSRSLEQSGRGLERLLIAQKTSAEPQRTQSTVAYDKALALFDKAFNALPKPQRSAIETYIKVAERCLAQVPEKSSSQ